MCLFACSWRKWYSDLLQTLHAYLLRSGRGHRKVKFWKRALTHSYGDGGFFSSEIKCYRRTVSRWKLFLSKRRLREKSHTEKISLIWFSVKTAVPRYFFKILSHKQAWYAFFTYFLTRNHIKHKIRLYTTYSVEKASLNNLKFISYSPRQCRVNQDLWRKKYFLIKLVYYIKLNFKSCCSL